MNGPAWIGIGAQRSGTTWLTDLLTQHPNVTLNRKGRKELHYFDRFGIKRWRRTWGLHYQSLFGPLGGEFTPAYLRLPWVPNLIRRTCPDTVVVVMLRDPINRYASAMRWRSRIKPDGSTSAWARERGADAAWGGMYADQLAAWEGLNLHVIQYEAAAKDPQSTVNALWRQLGVEPVPLHNVDTPAKTSTAGTFDWPPGLEDSLRAMYRSQRDRLDDLVDLSLWPTFN